MLNRVLVLSATLILSSQLMAGQAAPPSPGVSFLTAPLAFTINEGQWNESARFSACSGGAAFWFMSDRVVYQFVRGYSEAAASSVTSALPDSVVQQILTASFPGSNPDAELIGDGKTTHISNYFLGNDPSNWHTDVPNYSAIVYREIYPGIDLRYFGNGRMLEYDFIISPGADPSQIAVRYDGATDLCVNENGELEVETTWGRVVEHRPQVYQLEGESKIAVACKYQLIDSNTFTFELLDSYNPQLALVIDPVLYYSTYLGGSGFEYGFDIAVDGSGSAYIVGWTTSGNFPILNQFQTDPDFVNADIFVTKLGVGGNALTYSTYLGGSDIDLGYAIAVDGLGSAFITGYSQSTNYPTQTPYQTSQGSSDAIVTKLGPAGNTLAYSTYIGGSASDQASDIAIDNLGNAYIGGSTTSSNYPTLNPYQTDQVNTDGFVTKLSAAGNALLYSTYLGGSAIDAVSGIALDVTNNAYVAGTTGSVNFPTVGAFQTDQGGQDAFVTKLSSAGNTLIYSTYLGGTASDGAAAIAINGSGNAFVLGSTGSTDFPLQNPMLPYLGNTDAFVTKITPAGSALVFSTFLGGSNYEQPSRIAVDGSGNVLVAGHTLSANFPLEAPYQTYQGAEDAFVTKLNFDGLSLIYSTYLGGSGNDRALGITADGSGNEYITGYTASANFPTKSPYQSSQGGADVFIAKLVDLSIQVWSFPNSANNMWPQSWWSQNDYCQTPTPCQRNCALCDESKFPDWTAYKAAVGDSQTYFDPLTKNHMRPSAITKWRAIQRPWEGSCFGFAASNLLFINNSLSVSSQFPGNSFLSTVPISSSSRSLINKFALYQYGAQQQRVIKQQYTSDLFATALSIRDSLAARSPAQVLMMFNENGPGAHAVVPFRYEDFNSSPDTVHVHVYDSNQPGNVGILKLSIDPSTSPPDFWEYQGIPGWGGYQGIVLMDQSSNYLKRLVIADTLNGGINNYVQLFVGDNDSTNIDGVLGTIGHNSDSLYNTVTGAVPMTPATGTAVLPIGYFLPEGAWTCRETGQSDFPIWIVDGNQATFRSGGAKSGIISAPAQVYSYNAVTTTFGLTGANTSLKSPDAAASYDVQVIALETDSEVVYLFEGIEVAFGDTVFFQLQSDNKLKVSNCGDLTNYDLQIEVMNALRDTSFYYSTVTLASNSAHLISANWRENNDSLLIQVATGGCNSGIFNSTIKVPNEGVPPDFVCGDANGSGAVSISDVVFLINYIFSGGPAPNPLAAADANCSGGVNISDAVYLINYIFSGGAAPCAACK